MVDGICPYCSQHTLLISIVNDFFRCLSCGGDIEQKVNGKINYIPVQLEEFNEVKKRWLNKILRCTHPGSSIKNVLESTKKTLNKKEKLNKKLTRYKGGGKR